jgi:hypothetical protein
MSCAWSSKGIPEGDALGQWLVEHGGKGRGKCHEASASADGQHDGLLENLLIICKWLIYRYIEKTKTAKGTNWEQKFQKPQNENICLTNLNVENKGNFPILSSGECKLKNIFHSKFYQIS